MQWNRFTWSFPVALANLNEIVIIFPLLGTRSPIPLCNVHSFLHDHMMMILKINNSFSSSQHCLHGYWFCKCLPHIVHCTTICTSSIHWDTVWSLHHSLFRALRIKADAFCWVLHSAVQLDQMVPVQFRPKRTYFSHLSLSLQPNSYLLSQSVCRFFIGFSKLCCWLFSSKCCWLPLASFSHPSKSWACSFADACVSAGCVFCDIDHFATSVEFCLFALVY